MKIAFIISNCKNMGHFKVAKEIADNLYSRVEKLDVYYLKETVEKLSFKSPCRKINLREGIEYSDYDIIHSHGFKADVYLSITGRNI